MLLERNVELDALDEALTRARTAAGSTCVVIGPPGIGKSALLAAAGERAAAAGFRLLSARGGELEQEHPYSVMRQLFEGVLRAADSATRTALLDGPARPAGALLGGEYVDAPGDAVALEHAFYWLVTNLAERGPVALLVDDVHWADAASLRALVYLARRLAELPVLLVVATRPFDAADVARRSVAERLAAEATRLEPVALSEAGVGSLIRGRLDGADEQFCRACHSASGGNPFLVTELIGAVRASGVQPIGANAGRVRAVGARSVMRSVLLRLAGLSAAAAPVARSLAVLAECGMPSLLARLAAVPEPEAAAALDELRAAHILAPDEPARFVHAIVHDAVYDDIPPAQRSAAHAAAARLLAEAGHSADVVAGQLLLTLPGSDPWVFEQLIGAASTPLAMSAPEATAAYLDRALQESVVGVDRTPLLLGLGAARFQTVTGGAVAPLADALASATTPELRMTAARALASAYMTERRYDECWALVDELVAELAAVPEVARDLEIFAAQSLYTIESGGAAQLPRVASWRPDPAGAEIRDRSMLAVKSWAAMTEPSPADAVAVLAEAALSAGTLIHDDTWYVTFEMAIWALIASGRYDAALAHLDAAIDSCRTVGRLLRAATLMPVRAELHRRHGRLDLAEEDARFAVDVIPPQQIYAPQSASALVLVQVDQGKHEDAWRTLAAHGFATDIPDGGVADILWLARGRLRTAEGDLAGGVADLLHYGAINDGLGRRNPGYWPWRSMAAPALVQLGRREEALALALEEQELAAVVGLPELRGSALVALGIAQAGASGLAALTEGAALLAGSGFALDAARAQLALGRALRLDGKPTLAREQLRAALDSAARMGAAPLAEQAREELVATGARPRRTATHGVAALTPSELRVARLATEGRTNREIAHTLYVTPKTIEAHLASAYRKLGIAGKTELSAQLFG